MKNLFIIIFLSSLVFGCKRRTDPIGPEYIVAQPDFRLLGDGQFTSSAIGKKLDLTKVKGTFYAQFSQNVSWIVTLNGLTSGSYKTFSGVNDKIDATTFQWNGGHEGIYFFRKAEKVVATLSILGLDTRYTDTITLTQERNYAVKGKVSIVFNFEQSNLAYQFYDGPTTYELTYKSTFPFKGDSLSDMMKLTNNKKDIYIRNIDGDTIKEERSVEGTFVYRFAGKDGTYLGTTETDYFVGGGGAPLVPATLALDPDPKNVYFNIFIYGTGDQNSSLVVNFGEDDGILNTTTGKVVYNNSSDAEGRAKNYVLLEDEYTWQTKVDWKGWRMVSVNYSQLSLSADGSKALRGNKILEPNRIAKIGLVLIAGLNTKASVVFDYAVFTMGVPFNPND